MSESTTPAACPTPRCPRCGAPMQRAPAPPGAFGLARESCFECDDATPARQIPWACPACGGVWLFEAPGRGS